MHGFIALLIVAASVSLPAAVEAPSVEVFAPVAAPLEVTVAAPVEASEKTGTLNGTVPIPDAPVVWESEQLPPEVVDAMRAQWVTREPR